MAPKPTAEGYDPSRSKVSDNTMKLFLDTNLTGDLNDVPGLGEKGILKLANHSEPITNSIMLVGKYLSLKGPDVTDDHGNSYSVTCKEHNDAFWKFLKKVGIDSHRSAVCQAIAKKSAQFIPGLYEYEIYGEQEGA